MLEILDLLILTVEQVQSLIIIRLSFYTDLGQEVIKTELLIIMKRQAIQELGRI
jgi:hypothetical protein